MTRLLMTADAVGGVWQYATDLAAALLPHGVVTTLAVLGPVPSDDQRAMVAPGVTLVETGLPLDWLSDGAAPVLAAGEAMAALARARDADLVQLNMPTLGAEARFGVPVVAVTHGCVATWWEAARDVPLDAGFHWHRALMRRGLAAADLVVAPTAAYAATVAHAYGLPAAPVAVHNGRTRFGTIGERVAARAFTAGRLWDAVKGASLLDRVAARLSVPLRAAGPLVGPHGERVAVRHVDALGVLSSAALAAEIAARPVFVSAATFEPFGLAVLEAAGAGCPLVLSDIASFRELWEGVATFVDPADEDGFAAAIERIIADPALHDQFGRAAAARAARYTPDVTALAMARLYAGLLGAGSGRRVAA